MIVGVLKERCMVSFYEENRCPLLPGTEIEDDYLPTEDSIVALELSDKTVNLETAIDGTGRAGERGGGRKEENERAVKGLVRRPLMIKV